jgi:hypothetical protein
VYKDFGYSIEDLDRALINYINSAGIYVTVGSTNIRVKSYLETPDELYARKQIPSISVHSGFLVTNPDSWKSHKLGEVNPVDSTIVTQELVSLFYTYKISYMVSDPRHSSKLMMVLSLMFPKYFELRFKNEDIDYSAGFKIDQAYKTMDEIVDGVKVYRKDILMETLLTTERVSTEKYFKSQGVEFENISNII